MSIDKEIAELQALAKAKSEHILGRRSRAQAGRDQALSAAAGDSQSKSSTSISDEVRDRI